MRNLNNRSHTALYSTSGVAGPAQRPGIHEVHWAAVPSPAARVSAGEVVVVAMGTVPAAVAVAERYGPRISCQMNVMGRTYTTSFPCSIS